MPNPTNREPETSASETNASEVNESFNDILAQYEQTRPRKSESGGKSLEGTVVAVTADSVIVDIGYKSEGILHLTSFEGSSENVKPGDKLSVSVKGRDAEGYYELTRFQVATPTDWSSLQQAFKDKAAIAGTVTAVVKGGLSVDVGVRAFMPASRSGARDAAEMEKLVGQEIRCRITKFDISSEDLVVDRRAVLEDEVRSAKERRYTEVKEGDTVQGTVRSLVDYGAFVDIGGVDALLHVADISWTRVSKPSDVLAVGQQIEARVLKIDPEKRRISIGLKQLLRNPWDLAAERYKPGERVRGTVARLTDFGAFVELEPGVEGLIHVSEMSWARKVKRPGDMLKVGESVEAVILGVNIEERRISLGLKQALGDPWADVSSRFAVSSIIEGPVTSFTTFGAFVQLAEGLEGMIHVSDIATEKGDIDTRVKHPQDVLRVGQPVRAQVLEIDRERRRIRLGMKQLIPTSVDEYFEEHHEGDAVTGRVVEETGEFAKIELGEGIHGTCRIASAAAASENKTEQKVDLSALSSMLKARWKGGAGRGSLKQEPLHTGQIRSFRISKLDPAAKKIELELTT